MNHSCVVTPTATIPVPASLQGVSLLEFADFSMNGEHLNLPGRGSCGRHLAVVMVLLVLAHRAKAVKTEENSLSLPQSDVDLEQLFQKSLYKIEVSSNTKRFNITVILFYKNTDFFPP